MWFQQYTVYKFSELVCIEHKQVWRYQGTIRNRKSKDIQYYIYNVTVWPKKERRRVKPLRTNDRLSYTNSTKDRGELGCSTEMDENDLMCNKILLYMHQFHNASIYSDMDVECSSFVLWTLSIPLLKSWMEISPFDIHVLQLTSVYVAFSQIFLILF